MMTLAGDTDFLFSRIKTARKEFYSIARRFNKFMEKGPKQIADEWQDELVASVVPTRGKKREELFNAINKKFRLRALELLSQEFYKDLWYIRSEIEMSLIIMKMGPIAQFVNFSSNWEEQQLSLIKPLVMRMRNPKTIPPASKLRRHTAGGEMMENVKRMFLPFQEVVDTVKINFKKVSCPEVLTGIEVEMAESSADGGDVISIRKKYQRAIKELHEKKSPYTSIYRKLFIIRNGLNLLTQSASPRVDFKTYRERLQNDEKNSSS